MPVTFEIKVTSPLTDEDKQFLVGLGMMTVAIGTSDQQQQEEATEPLTEPPYNPPARPYTQRDPDVCGVLEYVKQGHSTTATGRICGLEAGHKAGHIYTTAGA